MTPFNFSRSARKQFAGTIQLPEVHSSARAILEYLSHDLEHAVKFMLPDGGEIIDDPALTNLDDTFELRLPFGLVALEYRVTEHPEPGLIRSSRRIILARERGDLIDVMPISWYDDRAMWAPIPGIGIPKTNYLDRTRVVNGAPTVRCMKSPAFESLGVTDNDVLHEIRTLLGVINALRCTNVGITRDAPRDRPRSIKSALPFDTYHILTIGRATKPTGCTGASQPHRSPREHLRRGHIRVYETGLRIWVNSTVVNAGHNGGILRKDYALRAAAC